MLWGGTDNRPGMFAPKNLEKMILPNTTTFFGSESTLRHKIDIIQNMAWVSYLFLRGGREGEQKLGG